MISVEAGVFAGTIYSFSKRVFPYHTLIIICSLLCISVWSAASSDNLISLEQISQ